MIASLTVENLSCLRGERVLFRDLCFRVGGGEMLGLEGPNGSGKTSLLRIIAGLLAPQAGKVCIGEIDEGEERGRFIGWLGHQDGFKPQLTAGEQLEFFARLYGVKDDIAPILARVNLMRQRDLPCRFLSAGQRTRLALARLVLCRRPLWLLDEPFAALDTQGKNLTRECVGDHVKAGGIAIIATHEPIGGSSVPPIILGPSL